MREILFRGKRIETGEWVDGNLFVSDTNARTYILCGSRTATIDWEVDPSTICQYTGLKDKKGKRIFEGNIIRWNDWNGDDQEGAVVWDPEFGRFAVFLDGAQSVGVNSHLGTNVKVIGDIHDNTG